ncbi:MAG TPA: hypothetical protein VIL11_04960 [Limnochordales bacterium]
MSVSPTGPARELREGAVVTGARCLVLYSGLGGVEELARAVGEGLRGGGLAVDLVRADRAAPGPFPVGAYVLVCLGSPVLGGWRGQAAHDVLELVGRCRPLEGKRGACFVRRRLWGTRSALLQMMAALERQGVWVEDFEAVASPEQARRFGQRLQALATPRRAGAEAAGL